MEEQQVQRQTNRNAKYSPLGDMAARRERWIKEQDYCLGKAYAKKARIGDLKEKLKAAREAQVEQLRKAENLDEKLKATKEARAELLRKAEELDQLLAKLAKQEAKEVAQQAREDADKTKNVVLDRLIASNGLNDSNMMKHADHLSWKIEDHEVRWFPPPRGERMDKMRFECSCPDADPTCPYIHYAKINKTISWKFQ